MENKAIIITADGSLTLHDEVTGEHYHSTNGALAESMHVFINAGLHEVMKQTDSINVLEIGFGTGLNALLSWHVTKGKAFVNYDAIDARPVTVELAKCLNYGEIIADDKAKENFLAMHQASWNTAIGIDRHFMLNKILIDLLNFEADNDQYDLVYFDAFSPAVQPELWAVIVFSRLFKWMKSGGIITTYSAKGSVKQAMRQAGFMLERLPGPPGKRHMLRGRKTGQPMG